VIVERRRFDLALHSTANMEHTSPEERVKPETPVGGTSFAPSQVHNQEDS